MTASMSSLHHANPGLRHRRDAAGRPHLRVIEGGAARAARPSPAVLRRRRVVALVLVVALVAGAYQGVRAVADAIVRPPGSGTLSGPGSAAAGPAASPGAVHIVQPGDTLWSIAAELDPGADPRRVVAELSSMNGGASLAVGQRLVLPDRLAPGGGTLALTGAAADAAP
ncbi:MAG: LysM domain-containing protein [Actinomycetota bacterium]|nr:LysM domain-containing protein [Actinomycetota bacterium]